MSGSPKVITLMPFQRHFSGHFLLTFTPTDNSFAGASGISNGYSDDGILHGVTKWSSVSWKRAYREETPHCCLNPWRNVLLYG
jgi:hypothetical protein